MPPVNRDSSAFSLVELSIVLVIVGLLVGGVLVGQSLIRAAELRSIPQQLQRYESAVNSFRDKYSAYPGDMPNAVRFWGAQAGAATDGVDATCAALTTAATSAATCNGNGDGLWGGGWPIISHEQFRAWQHLANAGLVEGSYAGVGIGTTNTGVIGQNIPATKISSVGVGFYYIPTAASAVYFFPSIGGTVAMMVGTINGVDTSGYAFSPQDQWNIDEKFDDGKPGTGKIFSQGNGSCISANNSASASYQIQSVATICTFYWRLIN